MGQTIIGSSLAPLLLAVLFLHRLGPIIGIMFAIGELSALSRASILAFHTELGRTHGMGTLAGLQGSAFATGQMIGPPVSGLVADGLGLSTVFPFGSTIGLLGSGFVLMWLRRWRRGGGLVNQRLPRKYGSRLSRRPSPNKLNPITVNRMAKPGKVAIHQYC